MKQKLWSRAAALVMTLCMVITMVPSAALAAEEEPYDSNGFAADGSYQPAVQADNGVYEISNAGQLYWFARLVNGYYNSSNDYKVGQNTANARLTADITVNETVNESARTWMPISSETLRYMGTFDGNGHSISGLYFPGTTTYTEEDADHYAAAVVVYEENGNVKTNGDANGDTDAGLFGFIGENGVVKNVTVKNSVFKNGYMDLGAIAGTSDGTVQNCTSENNTVLGNHSVGGVVGNNNFQADSTLLKDCKNSSHVTAQVAGGGITGSNHTNGTVENCTNNGKIDGSEDIGGIAGAGGNQITDCVNHGAVTSNGDRAAGIAANVGNIKITNCKNYGSILSKSDYAGGIAASTANTNAIINCENHGDVMADSTAAADCGYFVGGIVGAATKNTQIKSCNNTGNVSAAGSVAGGIAAGLEGTSSIERSSNSGTITAKIYSGGIAGRMSYSGVGSSVNNCFNTGKVTTAIAGFYAGGIVGQNGRNGYEDRGGHVKNSWNSGEVTVPGSYSAYAGGIYGNVYGVGAFENCYYLNGSATKAAINGSVTQPDEMDTAQSADVFASGQITWYLNKGNTETVWYQNVDNDKTHDACPVLEDTSDVVYRQQNYCGNGEVLMTTAYTNNAEKDEDFKESHTYQWEANADQHWGTCTRCNHTVEKENHTFGDWVTVTDGVQKRTCTVCGYTQFEDTESGNISKTVEVAPGAPATTMDTSKSDLARSNILTDSEKNSVESGTNAHIWLEVKPLEDSAVPETDKTAIEAKAAASLGSEANITYLDISLFKKVGTDAQEKVTDVNTPISITITIPENIRQAENGMRRTFYVIRSHDGAQVISGNYDSATGNFTFQTDKFSTYALAYQDSRISSGGSGGSITTYPVELPKSVSGGTIKSDKSSAAKGSTVTITVTPDKGYELGKLTVTDKDGNTLSLTSKGNGQYSFTMPAGKVTVTASFVETDWNLAYRNCPKDSTCPIWPYTDAETTAWYHDGVHFCLENGLMVGYGNHIFKPDTSTSRAMLSVMLWRLNGSPVVNYAMTFQDVAADSWYGEAVRWAASQGIVTGYDTQTFGPDNNVTREQMVTILYRYAKTKGYDVSVGENTNILSYADAASVSEYAIPAMQWGCGSGMVQGTDNKLLPQGSTTRAQMATMMMRFCAEIVK